MLGQAMNSAGTDWLWAVTGIYLVVFVKQPDFF